MFVHYRTRGFIFKKNDRGEADQLFSIYTKDFGKLEIVGKAIRKIASKLRSGAERFYLSEVEFIQGKGYKTLTDAVLVEKFRNIRRNPEVLYISERISEALDILIRGQEQAEKIWILINEVFNALNSQDTALGNRRLIYYYFLWNLFLILGYHPEVYSCVVCRKQLSAKTDGAESVFYFDHNEGGVICQKCSGGVKFTRTIKPETIKLFRIIFKKDINFLLRLKTDEETFGEIEYISNNYLSAILEKPVNIGVRLQSQLLNITCEEAN